VRVLDEEGRYTGEGVRRSWIDHTGARAQECEAARKASALTNARVTLATRGSAGRVGEAVRNQLRGRHRRRCFSSACRICSFGLRRIGQLGAGWSAEPSAQSGLRVDVRRPWRDARRRVEAGGCLGTPSWFSRGRGRRVLPFRDPHSARR
jgi:hypothetical protein